MLQNRGELVARDLCAAPSQVPHIQEVADAAQETKPTNFFVLTNWYLLAAIQ